MIRSSAALGAALLLVAAAPVSGLDLPLPNGARALFEQTSPLDSYELPTAAFDGADVPARRLEGQVTRKSWRIGDPSLTTLQILDPLRDALTDAGFALEFECADSDCGGFDFRFGTEVIPAPDMHVNIRDFRFVSATREGDAAVSLLVSRGRNTAHVQMVRVERGLSRPRSAQTPPPSPTAAAGVETPDRTFLETLVADGHIVLGDLVFASGSSRLASGTYASLARIAAYLAQTPGVKIALVGHTDSIGTLERNIALSKRRAASVRDRLIKAHGVDPARIEAEGMGYLSPIASNLSPDGRRANRRVEAILLTPR